MKKICKVLVIYFFNILVSLDQLLNTIFGGHPKQTISSRIGKMKKNNEMNFITHSIDWILEKIDNNHCIKSIEKHESNYVEFSENE